MVTRRDLRYGRGVVLFREALRPLGVERNQTVSKNIVQQVVISEVPRHYNRGSECSCSIAFQGFVEEFALGNVRDQRWKTQQERLDADRRASTAAQSQLCCRHHGKNPCARNTPNPSANVTGGIIHGGPRCPLPSHRRQEISGPWPWIRTPISARAPQTGHFGYAGPGPSVPDPWQ